MKIKEFITSMIIWVKQVREIKMLLQCNFLKLINLWSAKKIINFMLSLFFMFSVKKIKLCVISKIISKTYNSKYVIFNETFKTARSHWVHYLK